MTKFRRSLMGVAALLASVGMALVPAQAAHATPIDDCNADAEPVWNSGDIRAGGNNYTPVASPFKMFHNDVFRVTARGTITIDYWGTRKSVNGDPTTGDSTWPADGERRYMLLAKVDKGKVVFPTRDVEYTAGQLFPVGFDSTCFRYERTTPITSSDPSAKLTFSYNDPNLGDNGGAGFVTVRQWF